MYFGAEEFAKVHRFVDVWDRAGYMSGAEAAAWQERIAIWQRFRPGGWKALDRPAADPLLDDPDTFLP